MCVLRVRYGIDRQSSFQYAPKKEAECRHTVYDRADGELSFMQQMGLPLTDVIGAEPIGRLAEESRESLDSAEIAAYSLRREVTTLEFFQHHFAKTGHRDLLATRTLSQNTVNPKTIQVRARAASAAPAASFKSAIRKLRQISADK